MMGVAGRVYEFHSAHFKSVAEVRDLWRRQDSRKNKGPLQKSGPLTVFAELLDSTESGDSLRWLPPSLAGNGMHHANINDSMAKSTPDYGQHMLKSEHGPVPAGAHWITVHGGSGKGSPILVMPHEDGSMRVIGGAGGALNHLKLHSVKTGESYKDSIKQRQQERQEARKKQVESDKAAGIHDQKLAERVLR